MLWIVARSVLLGVAVVFVGNQPWQILFALNVRTHPALPWSVLLSALWLWIFWRWLGGSGAPRSLAAARRSALRACALPASRWRAALAFGATAWTALLLLEIAFLRLAQVPTPATELNQLPLVLRIGFVGMTAITAGVVEEAGFRGWMQVPLERRLGPHAAIAITSFVFLLAHAEPGHSSLATLAANSWFYLSAGVAFGFLAWSTGSIWPGIVVHVAADVVGITLQLWAASRGASAGAAAQAAGIPWTWLAGGGACALAAVALARNLRRSSAAGA